MYELLWNSITFFSRSQILRKYIKNGNSINSFFCALVNHLQSWINILINSIIQDNSRVSDIIDWKDPHITDRSCMNPAVVTVWLLSSICLFVIPWTIASRTPPSMGFPRKEHWSQLSFPPLSDLTQLRIKSTPPALEGWFFTAEPPGKPNESSTVSLILYIFKKYHNDFFCCCCYFFLILFYF